jgi:hypothetical protein
MDNHILPLNPPNPDEAIRAFEGCRHRAEVMLAEAKTSADRMDAQFWIDNADRNIDKWRAQQQRGQR